MQAAAAAPAAGAAVRVDGLEHAYGARVALRGVRFEVGQGEIFALLGPNGGGKTTLFRILSTLLEPTGGAARILGCDVVRERDAVRRRIGVVFQAPALDRKLTVRENLVHQGHLYGLRGAELARRIDAGLQRFGLAERGRDLVEDLSVGLRRRVELAKGLLHGPQVVLLDEPSTGLDPGARRDLWALLQEIRAADGVTVLLTSHILEEVERADRVAILDRGALVALGSPRELEDGLGGSVVSVVGHDPERLQRDIAARFGLQAAAIDGTLRFEQAAGPDLVHKLAEAFPNDIESMTLARPTLEDVFIHCTGHAFDGREGGA
jgi:ABC-2 type transport system ATP-binding protein